jgi:hypothetical protein
MKLGLALQSAVTMHVSLLVERCGQGLLALCRRRCCYGQLRPAAERAVGFTVMRVLLALLL